MGRVEDLLVYFIREYDQETVLTRTKLYKLAFIADARFYYDEGIPLTGIRYVKYASGPFNKALDDALESLVDDERIAVYGHQTGRGTQYHHEALNPDEPLDALPSAAISVAADILDDCAHLDTTRLVNRVRETPSVSQARKYTPVDFPTEL